MLGCCTLQTLVEIIFLTFFVQKTEKAREFTQNLEEKNCFLGFQPDAVQRKKPNFICFGAATSNLFNPPPKKIVESL